MARYVTAINGMGSVSFDGSSYSTTGMKDNDIMHISNDFMPAGGVVKPDDLKVTQNGTPDRSVNVAGGVAYIPNYLYTANDGTNTKYWRVENTTSYNVSIDSNTSGYARYTSIFAKVDVSVNPGSDGENVLVLYAVNGTPASSPTPPATPNNCIRLADVYCANGFTSITNSDITDKRCYAGLEFGVNSGWIPANETWTYSSVDDPTGEITVPGDKTQKYCAGMRLRMVNNGNVVYGIISKNPTYSPPNTTITFLHEINPSNSLALCPIQNSAITDVYYSTAKCPFGFPLSPRKWQVVYSESSEKKQNNPVWWTWYNVGNHQCTVPIGAWRVGFETSVIGAAGGPGDVVRFTVALSPSVSSNSDLDLTAQVGIVADNSDVAGGVTPTVPISKYKSIEITSKTTYYIIFFTIDSNVDYFGTCGNATTRIVAQFEYL